MTTNKPFSFRDYLAIGLRRKWYIIVPLIISIFVSFGVYKYLPKIYMATTLILVQPQTVPESYVRPTITESVATRLSTISQEILSRTRLEKVIHEFNLYPDLRPNIPMEGIVEGMRKMVEVKVQNNPQTRNEQTSFSISFLYTDPQIVMMVANKLASLFIEENLKVRESQAESTSTFLSKELMDMEHRLKEKEQDIRSFKERSMGQLPEQLDANLRILERLQQQLQTTIENMRSAEDRSLVLQNQMEQLKPKRRLSASLNGERVLVAEDTGGSEDPLITELNNLKKELASAQSKYLEAHPDVIDLKRKIARLKPKVEELLEKQAAERGVRVRTSEGGVREEYLSLPRLDPAVQRLLAQYEEQHDSSVLEAKRAREEIANLKEQIALYQKRIEETPKREQELTLLTRDYDLLKTNYQSLLDKKIQAQMAENLERKQQGEQFKVLDPATRPEKPVKPDRNNILLMGGMIGLAMGLGLAWLRESADRSFHAVSDVEDFLEVPVIAAIPNLNKERKGRRKVA